MDASIVGFVKEKMTLRPSTIDDDFVDRLHHHFTCVLLMLFAAIGFLKSFLGQPLQCFVPANFKPSWESYAESYCFIQHTYYVAWEDDIPMDADVRIASTRRVSYYQWVPLLLGLQAFLFYVPSWFWKMLYWKSGFRLDEIVKAAVRAQAMRDDDKKAIKLDDRNGAVKLVAEQVQEGIDVQRDRRVGPWASFQQSLATACGLCMCRRTFGNLLVNVYLLSKLLYLVNLVLQMFLVHAFVGGAWNDFPLFGLRLLVNLTSGRDWHASGTFPRVTYCDFKVRVMGQPKPNPHTVQCVLPVNMLNEKIYLILWFWFAFLFALTIYNVFMWLVRTWLPFSAVNFVGKYLNTTLPGGERPDAEFVKRQKTEYENKYLPRKKEWLAELDRAKSEEERKEKLKQKPERPETRRFSDTPRTARGQWELEYLYYMEDMEDWQLAKDLAKCDKEKTDLDKAKPKRPQPRRPGKEELKSFVQTYLKRDGVFVLRLVAANASYLVSSLVIEEIYTTMCENIYKNKLDEEPKQKREGSPRAPSDEGIDTLRPRPQAAGGPPSYPRAPPLNDVNDDSHPLIPPKRT